MTGGIGFSRDSSNTQKKNRSLSGFRKSNAKNPYWGSKKKKIKASANYNELIRWKKYRTSVVRKRSILVFIMVVVTGLILFLFV